MDERNPKNIFIEGAIPALFIADSIEKHSTKKEIGGHSIFLGQVREDIIHEKKVRAIEYTAYEEMVLKKIHLIREVIIEKHNLTCMHVRHSLGIVEAGAICLFVFTSSAHRKAAMDACEEIVERIKSDLPIWGKEIFDDSTHHWKTNK